MGLFDALPSEVSLYEVSLRDGLQNERATVLLRDKIRLADALASAGLKRIELTSFVSPKWIPQLADADELARHVPKFPGVVWSALCPNERGLERAKAAGIEEIAVFMSASETHNQRNVNKTIAATLATFDNVIAPAVASGIRVRGYVSTAWGCPYEGEVVTKSLLATRSAAERLAKRVTCFGSSFRSSSHRSWGSTCTTRAAPPSRTCLSDSRWAFVTSMHRSPVWAVARMRREQPVTWRRKTSSICSTEWASRRASTSRSSWRQARLQKAWSAASCRARFTSPVFEA